MRKEREHGRPPLTYSLQGKGQHPVPQKQLVPPPNNHRSGLASARAWGLHDNEYIPVPPRLVDEDGGRRGNLRGARLRNGTRGVLVHPEPGVKVDLEANEGASAEPCTLCISLIL